MFKGIVKWFDEAKGFGVIIREDGGNFFVDVSSIMSKGVKKLCKGEMVFFDIGRGRKGLEAIYVLLPGKKVEVSGSDIVSY